MQNNLDETNTGFCWKLNHNKSELLEIQFFFLERLSASVSAEAVVDGMDVCFFQFSCLLMTR